jgi:hypothetical protein
MKYNQASLKQSHNSYDRREDSHVSLLFHPNNPDHAGCRALEYDIWRHSDETGGRSVGYFTVAHDSGDGPPFASYLGNLLSWHLADPLHDVVFVTVDIKSSAGSKEVFPDEIDEYLREWFSAGLMFSPRDLSPASDDLVAHVRANGWPEVESMRGKFVFCLSGNASWKSYYARTKVRSRLCFADIDFAGDKAVTVPSSGQQIIYSAKLELDDADSWSKSIAALRAANLITRGYILNAEDVWTKAKRAKLNVFATDKITGHDWAQVGSRPFVAL